MSRNNDLGKLRRSQVVTVFGPGAVVDFRAAGPGGAPISVVAAGLEEWDQDGSGVRSGQNCVFEPRLQRLLSKDGPRIEGFRLPPVLPDAFRGIGEAGSRLVGVRFPSWLQCPRCFLLKEQDDWERRAAGDPMLLCPQCSTAGDRCAAVPVRFITACENGHLDDFPWHRWVSHKDGCIRGRLKLEGGQRAGLSGLVLSCLSCGARRPMAGCFGKDALRGSQCRGRRPWLASAPESCSQELRVLQRGASNLYFPILVSSLDIPPWSDRIQKQLGMYWEDLRNEPQEHRLQFIRVNRLANKLGLIETDLLQKVNQRIAILEASTEHDLRKEEHQRFFDGAQQSISEDSEFEIRQELILPELRPWINRLIRVTRLRAVTALRAFTRIKPPAGDDDQGVGVAKISIAPLNWLPAIEVRGEGIFISLNLNRVKDWERSNRTALDVRVASVAEAFRRDWDARRRDGKPPTKQITARFLLVHSLAHALMRQLALSCGYSSSALRERLYVGTDETVPMAALLIYTATTDSDGTLGGLMQQGHSQRFLDVMSSALQSMEFCSSDPLCILGVQSRSEPMNGAACHACLLAPETSCEEFNRLLDRALLIGTEHEHAMGFFRELLDALNGANEI